MTDRQAEIEDMMALYLMDTVSQKMTLPRSEYWLAVYAFKACTQCAIMQAMGFVDRYVEFDESEGEGE